jgi:hypothetical protein
VYAILTPLAKLTCAPTLIILWVIANDWVMANDLDDLDEAERRSEPAQRGGWSRSTNPLEMRLSLGCVRE